MHTCRCCWLCCCCCRTRNRTRSSSGGQVPGAILGEYSLSSHWYAQQNALRTNAAACCSTVKSNKKRPGHKSALSTAAGLNPQRAKPSAHACQDVQIQYPAENVRPSGITHSTTRVKRCLYPRPEPLPSVLSPLSRHADIRCNHQPQHTEAGVTRSPGRLLCIRRDRARSNGPLSYDW